MYAGRIVETGNVDQIFDSPKMPYTWGLLDSLPRLDDQRGGKLRTIEGLPPLLIKLPDACRFNPRCAFARDLCREREPALTPREEGHVARCHGTEPDGWIPT
jgi:oligopeptide/dipeptide ABC transporter ATP-binding protein